MARQYPYRDLKDQVFNRLVAKEYVRIGPERWGWLCECKCGNVTKVKATSLTSGRTQSCGCLQAELTSLRKGTHRLSRTRVHRIWCAMKTRCTNSNIRNHMDYGGRGIKVCERWMNSFEDFIADMGMPPSDEHSLDRFPDKDGDYEPGNCRWATPKDQGRNKRNNRILEFRGEAKPASEWAEALGIHIQTILFRLRKGWSVERALSEPPRKRGSGTSKRNRTCSSV